MANLNVKKRNWAFVVYPESLPDNWIEILQQSGLQCAISPLHDMDMNADGEQKKPHYHVICCYSGPTSYNVVKSLTDRLNAPAPIHLEQVKGYYRYLTHKDNPEKAQYNDSDIHTVNGFNIADFSELTRSEVNAIKSRLSMLIRDEMITEYFDFCTYLLDNEMIVEYDIASSNTLYFDRYITSFRHKLKSKGDA